MIDKSALVLTRVKKALTNKYGASGIFVSSTLAEMPPKFPAAVIRQIGAPATGSGFASRQCACISTIEIQSFSELSTQQAKEIISTAADAMDLVGYELRYGPEDVTEKADIRRYVARFRRTIGAGDTI